jgi:non-ribosomal peptide synthetase component F
MLLSYYSGENDIVIGTNVANRNRSDLEGLIGFFINQLAIRTSLSANPTFRELLVRVREATLSAYAHQELPFEKVVEALNPKREPGYSPLFQVKINLVNTPEDTVSFGNLELRHFRVRQEGSHFDLTLSMEETGSGVLAAVQYSTDLFNEQTIVDMMADYEFLLTSVVADPDVKVETLRSVIKQRRDERHQTRIGEYKAEQKRKLTNLKRRFLEPPRPELGGDYDEHRI